MHREIRVGSQIKTRKVLKDVRWMGLPKESVRARKPGDIGIVKQIHSGNTADVCVVKHMNGRLTTYMLAELRRI